MSFYFKLHVEKGLYPRPSFNQKKRTFETEAMFPENLQVVLK